MPNTAPLLALPHQTLLQQLYHTFKSDLVFLSVLPGATVALPFKEDFQLVVVKNIDARGWWQRIACRVHFREELEWERCVKRCWNWTRSHRKAAAGHH